MPRMAPKLQIKLIRQKEKEEKIALTSHRYNTKNYSKTKKSPQDIKVEEEQREKDLQEFYAKPKRMPKIPTFADMYGTNNDKKPPLLVVDGYNLMFQFIKEKKIDKNLTLEQQRNILIEHVQGYQQWRSLVCYVFFDGQNCDYKGELKESFFQYDRNFSVTYTEKEEADTAIERLVTDPLIEEKYHYMVVVTSDRVLQQRVLPIFYEMCNDFIVQVYEADKEWRGSMKKHEAEQMIEQRTHGGLKVLLQGHSKLLMDAARLGMTVQQYKQHLHQIARQKSLLQHQQMEQNRKCLEKLNRQAEHSPQEVLKNLRLTKKRFNPDTVQNAQKIQTTDEN